MFEKVMIPLDGSDLAESIVPFLTPLLRRVNAEVILIQVAQYPAVPGTAAYVPLVEYEKPAKEYIERMATALSEQGIRARGIVRMGPAAPEILDAVDREDATLVGMTTHGRTGLARWVMGSVTEKVVRSSPSPVLVIRSYPEDGSRSANLLRNVMFAPERILVPLDGSENSMGVVPHAIGLARLFESRVTLLHVHEPGEWPDILERLEVVSSGTARDFGESRIQRAQRQFADAGVGTELADTSGDAGSRILETARHSGAKLIAMATHGRSGPTRWMLGSVTEKVLRASELPMLIVRSPQLKR